MVFKEIKKKLKIRLLIIFLIFFVIVIINYNSLSGYVYKNLNNNQKAIVLSIFSNKKTTLKIFNDERTKFLPETEQLLLDFKKIKIKNFEKIIKTENNSSQWVPYKKNQYKSFYVEKYKYKIVIMYTKVNFYYTQLNKINS